jgi:hypothetical protein
MLDEEPHGEDLIVAPFRGCFGARPFLAVRSPRMNRMREKRELARRGATPVRVAGMVVLLLGLAPACRHDEECSNGTCVCGAGENCDIGCAAPPCHVECDDRSTCSGTCANGDCTCDESARCDFSCASPPCQVICAGDNPSCAGTCANGTCTCGPNSSCQFTCSAGPCHTSCAAGSTCVVACPAATAGTEDCDIVSCAAGEAVVCPNGGATTCNAACPSGS